jgi:hypothetical protein
MNQFHCSLSRTMLFAGFFWYLYVVAAGFGYAAPSPPAPLPQWERGVTGGQLSVRFSPRGEIVAATLGRQQQPRAVQAGTRLAGCREVGEVVARALQNGAVQCTRQFAGAAAGQTATVVESFRPLSDSIRWEIEITGGQTPWSAPIETWLTWPEPAASKWWTAWADRRPGGGPAWEDPLVPAPFADRKLMYVAGGLTDQDNFIIPLAVLLDERHDAGLTVALSPEDLVLDMKLHVGRDGRMVFARNNHRLQSGRPVKFALDLVAHEADWRAGLGWMVARYRPYFDPPNPAVHEFAGCGAYSSHADISTPNRFMRMAFRANWKASFDFPYMGMFLPPTASDTEQWIDFKNQKNSIAAMREHSHRMRAMGFHVLNYFNVTECGANYRWPPPPRKAAADADLWRDSNDFLFYRVRPAILPGPDGKPIGSWCGCVAMDPGEPVYQDFLVEQARRHVEKLPESTGICIDRLDWLSMYNSSRDDGVSWVAGKPVRALAVSWRQIAPRIGRVMHEAGKVIYVNPLHAHLGWLRDVDGIYDEYGDYPCSLNRSGFLGVRKPVMAWTRDSAAVNAAPDAYFQRHLHMGAFLTAPLPGNDHTILPNVKADRYYLDYGPLLDALRGKRWVLKPRVIEVAVNKAKANLFEVPGGYVVPVTFGQAGRATVVLRGLPWLKGQQGFRAEMIRPGETKWSPLTTQERGGNLSIEIPLLRGCAMVKLAYAWIDPKVSWFSDTAALVLGTTLRDATLRYTLDGSMPTAASNAYSAPVRLQRTTVVRAAAFRNERRMGDVMSVEFVRLPPDAPAFAPAGGGFDGSVDVLSRGQRHL